ncbi:MAG: type IV secretion protein IcmT [Alphaproteobacteria bacterium]|nr:type IV secretion protein IcmT [Alphaproteobacteria bacterium]
MVKEIEVIQEKMNWHWRNSMRPVRFLAFDGRAAMPIPLLLVHARWSTLILTIVTLLVFRFLEQRGLTFPAALRNLRSWLVGKDRPGWVSAQRRKFIDLG